MQPEIRRIIAVDAHRRKTGHCPVLVHSLGTGESFAIRPTPDGFIDVSTGIAVRSSGERILLPEPHGSIDIRMNGDVAFDGFDHSCREAFSGRAGGGTSVTIYDGDGVDYFQYAVAVDVPAA